MGARWQQPAGRPVPCREQHSRPTCFKGGRASGSPRCKCNGTIRLARGTREARMSGAACLPLRQCPPASEHHSVRNSLNFQDNSLPTAWTCPVLCHLRLWPPSRPLPEPGPPCPPQARREAPPGQETFLGGCDYALLGMDRLHMEAERKRRARGCVQRPPRSRRIQKRGRRPSQHKAFGQELIRAKQGFVPSCFLFKCIGVTG